MAPAQPPNIPSVCFRIDGKLDWRCQKHPKGVSCRKWRGSETTNNAKQMYDETDVTY